MIHLFNGPAADCGPATAEPDLWARLWAWVRGRETSTAEPEDEREAG
jgi:hypothetical protein